MGEEGDGVKGRKGVEREFDDSGGVGEGVGDEEGGGGGEGEAEETVGGGGEEVGWGGEGDEAPCGGGGVEEWGVVEELGVGEEEEGRESGFGVVGEERWGEDERVEAFAGAAEVEEGFQREESQDVVQKLFRHSAPDLRLHCYCCHLTTNASQ